MIGGISGVNSMIGYHWPLRTNGVEVQAAEKVQRSAPVYAAGRATPLETPVQPVEPAKPVNADASGTIESILTSAKSADPAEMAVRMRMQYVDPTSGEMIAPRQEGLDDDPLGVKREEPELKNEPLKPEEALKPDEDSEQKSAQEVMEEAECETCENRKYQDGSDDPGVSFQAPAHIDADVAGSVVRGHEMEHVVREQAQAKLEEREVLRQSVILRNAICPECGRVYVSGGTTQTTTAKVQKPQPEKEEDVAQQQGFHAVA